MKTLLTWILMLLWMLWIQSAFAIDVDEYLNGESPYAWLEGGEGTEADIDLGADLQELTTGEDGVVRKLMEALGFNFGNDGNVVVQFISNIINFLLSIIGLIALAILIFWFYKMFFSTDQDGADGAKKLIINTFIALAVIGLARFITTFLFNLYFESVG